MPAKDAELLALDVATLFVRSDTGRILHDNAPDRSPGPRFYLGGCASANILAIRHDVSAATAHSLERLAASEPPLALPASTPRHLDEYVRLLAGDAPIAHSTSGLTWSFPARLAYTHDAPRISSDTPEGDKWRRGSAGRGVRPRVGRRRSIT